MAGTAAGAKKAAQTRMVRREREAALADANQRGHGFASGLNVNLQQIDEEYVPGLKDWRGRVNYYQRMGNDAKIAATLRANQYPLIPAKWTVEGGETEARDLVAANLLRQGDPALWCETSWIQRLFESLTSIQYGVSPFGKTREIVDGYMIFRRLTYLHPRSLGGPLGPWEWDDTGSRLVALHRSYTLPSGRSVIDERIPVEDLFFVVHGMAGENWEGSPMIRPMYRAWTEKDLASKIQMIDAQNRGVGIPMATLAAGDGQKAADTLWNIAKDQRGGSKERQAILLSDGQKMEFLTSSGSVLDMAPILAEKNNEIAAGAGTDFQQTGQTSSGSRATGSVLMVNYMQELDAERAWLQEQWNHGAGYLKGPVEELCDENFGPQKEYPQIVCRPVSATTQIDNVQHVIDSVQKGGMIHDLHVENYVRKSLGVHPLTAEEFRRAKDESRPVPSVGGRPDSPNPADREEPRDDGPGRAFGLQDAAEKKSPDGGSRPIRSATSYGWLASKAS
jgi:hypothetical protein